MEEKFIDIKTKIQSKMDEFRQSMESLQVDVVALKKVVLQGCSSSNKDTSPKVRVPKPKGFSDNCNV